MMRILTIFILVATSFQGFAQDELRFSQYMNMPLFYNPGVAGTHEDIPLRLIIRRQWMGIPGAPQTVLLSGHARYGRNNGLGALLMHDKAGAFTKLGTQLNYAYHLQVTEEAKLSFTAGVLAVQHSLDRELLTLSDPDPNFFQAPEKHTAVDGLFGAYFFTDKYYASIAIKNIFGSEVSFTQFAPEGIAQRRILYASGGYNFTLSENLKLTPSALVKMMGGFPPQVDINANFLYKDLFEGGLGYRHGDAIVILLGLRKDQFRFGYSYDLSARPGGAHELFFGFNIERKEGSTPAIQE